MLEVKPILLLKLLFLLKSHLFPFSGRSFSLMALMMSLSTPLVYWDHWVLPDISLGLWGWLSLWTCLFIIYNVGSCCNIPLVCWHFHTGWQFGSLENGQTRETELRSVTAFYFSNPISVSFYSCDAKDSEWAHFQFSDLSFLSKFLLNVGIVISSCHFGCSDKN